MGPYALMYFSSYFPPFPFGLFVARFPPILDLVYGLPLMSFPALLFPLPFFSLSLHKKGGIIPPAGLRSQATIYLRVISNRAQRAQ